jgi:hypothetical protein
MISWIGGTMEYPHLSVSVLLIFYYIMVHRKTIKSNLSNFLNDA